MCNNQMILIMLIKSRIPVFIFLLTLLISCREEEFEFDINHLTGTAWGIPQVMEAGTGHIDLDAPTIFDPSGFVTIGNARTDIWTIRGKRTIFLEEARENWFIISLSPNRLYVEKSSFPDGTFIVKCIYEPL
jgi:hypothetical protein